MLLLLFFFLLKAILIGCYDELGISQCALNNHCHFKAVKLAQSIRRSLWVREVASSSPISTNARVKIQCA